MLEYFTATSGGYHFSHESVENGGIKYPTQDTLHAHDPRTGEHAGELHYYPPKRKKAPVHVIGFGSMDFERKRGAGSALLDEMERRHPGSRIVWMDKLHEKNKPKPGDPNFNPNRDYGLPTDWDTHFPKLPGSIHRGIGITLGSGEAERVNSPHTPAAEQAKVLYRHVKENGSIGMHWSADPVKPHNFAFRNALDPRTDIPVVLHAETPERKDVETRPDVLRQKGVWPHDHRSGDAEVPIRKRRPVKVTGISWLPDVEHPEADETGWVHHTFDEPIQHFASVGGLFPRESGNTMSGDINDYFGGGHDAEAYRGRTAGRGKPRRDRDRQGAPGGGEGDPAPGQQRGQAGEGGGRLDGPRPVEFHPGAVKDLKGLDRPVQKQIKSVIDGIAAGDQGLQTHALTLSLKGWYSTKASRGHRVIHRPTDEGGIHVGYVGLHDYDKAIRRLTSREGSVRMVQPDEYSGFHYPDYPGKSTLPALVKHFRKTDPDRFNEIRDDVQKNGFTTPILVKWNDPRGTPFKKPQVMSGHHRAAVAYDLGLPLPVGDYDNEADFEQANAGNRAWFSKRASRDEDRPLPEKLYHVTTNLSGVLSQGLKTRDELGQQYGHGLGGGRSDTISLTTSKPTAEHLLHSLHEYHDVLNGKIKLADLKEKARKGVGAKDSYDFMMEDLPDERAEQIDQGHIIQPGFHILGEEPEGWEPQDKGFENGEKKAHMLWKRPLTDKEKIRHRSDAYKKFAWGRQASGGHPDPLFIQNDPDEFAKKDPSEFALLHVRPKEGAHGIQMNDRTTGTDAGEWRAHSGRDLDVVRHERRDQIEPREAAIGEDRYDPDDGEYARLWDDWHPQLQPEMHRHLSVRLPGDHPAHDNRLPMHERAQAVLDRVSEGVGHRPAALGWHWTDDPASKFLGGRLEPGHTHVVVHAKTPPREHIEDNRWTLLEDRAVKGWDHPEREVPLKRNAPVEVTGISWRPAGGQMVRHDFDHPITRQAAHPLPTSRVFGPTYGLDHRLFEGEHLRPEVRAAVMGKFEDFCRRHGFTDWQEWGRLVFFGSEASEWTSPDLEGNNDFDLSFGINFPVFKERYPRYASLQDAEIARLFTDQMHSELNDPGCWFEVPDDRAVAASA